ncbi:MAG: DUF2723 domain-containing protein [Bradymonadales bacterium]|nr:DUF2723 domain-containing protein [Bradymonadales bacterium]
METPSPSGSGSERGSSHRLFPVTSARTAVTLAAAAFLFHALTTSSGLFWLDAGDFATAGFDLGVPHPTGFPLYTLLGRLVSTIPLGPVSFRFSLLSAILAGATTGLVVALVDRLISPRMHPGTRLVAMVVACAGLWVTPVAGLLGRTPDVYVLHLLLVAASALVCLRLWGRFQAGDLLVSGFLVGLGLSNHAEYRLFAPVFCAVAVVALFRSAAQGGWKTRSAWVLGFLGLLAVGLLPYLYLPLAAGREPYHAWGHPDSLARFWNHVWGLTIRLAFPESFLSMSWPRVVRALEVFTGQILHDWGALLFLSGLGAVFGLIRCRLAAVLLVVLAVIDLGYAVLFNPMGLIDKQNGATTYLVLALFAGVGVAVGLSWLLSWLSWILDRLSARWSQGKKRVSPGPAETGEPSLLEPPVGRTPCADRRRENGKGYLAALILLVGGLLVVYTMSRADLRWLVMNGSWGAQDLTFQGLTQAPTGGLVLSDNEGFAAARLYLVGVGGMRPDLQVLNRTELSDSRLLVQRSRQGPFPLADDTTVETWSRWGVGADESTYQARIGQLLERAFGEGRAVVWGPGAARDSRGRWNHIELGFPLHRIFPEVRVDPRAMPPPQQLVPNWFLARLDLWGHRWLADYLNWLGTYYYNLERIDLAAWAWMAAVQHAPEWSPPVVNLGVLADRRGSYREAEALVAMATGLDPLNVTAWLNLARYRCLLSDREGAWAALERARALHAQEDRTAEVTDFLSRCPPSISQPEPP